MIKEKEREIDDEAYDEAGDFYFICFCFVFYSLGLALDRFARIRGRSRRRVELARV